MLRGIVANDAKASAIGFSTRFGHQMALLAGIEAATQADAVVMMDSDLQHPPELIPELVAKFREGYEVVYTIRKDTLDAGFLKKKASQLFYRILGALTEVPINRNAADFRLVSRRVADVFVRSFPERNMFLRGLFSWIGFKQTGIEFVAERRFAGTTKYPFSRMVRFATHGILSFSTKPLYFGLLIGMIFAGLAFLMIVYAIGKFFIAQSLPNGWTTIIVLLMLFSGVQLMVMGIIGTYIAGIYEEVKKRPRYIVEEEIDHLAAAQKRSSFG
jgi:dolichol-phosphate mannosyltransferase